VALAPIPVAFVMWALQNLFRLIARLEELDQKIQVEALTFAVAPITLLTFGHGFLEEFAGFPKVLMFAVWAMLALLRAVGPVMAYRRYR
jgi:hypothetical protein